MKKDPMWDPITQKQQTQAFIDGRNARFAGLNVEEANPYWPGCTEDLDFVIGWNKADELKKYIAEQFEKFKNYTPPPQDQFVEELEALLTKYDYEITDVNNKIGQLMFKRGHRWRYDFAVVFDDGTFMATRPLGG